MDQTIYWYWMSTIEEIGNAGWTFLLHKFNTPEGIFFATESDLKKIIDEKSIMNEKKIAAILQSRKMEAILYEFERMKQKKIHFMSKEDEKFPVRLRNIYDAPYYLYYKGKMPEEGKPAIAVIGTRECSIYGKNMALSLTKKLAEKGIDIISGMARGIDGWAHRGAIQGNGYTAAVLGSGVDICYPQENYELYEDIADTGGMISEYPLKSAGIPFHFPRRNRIISGLSDAILVVEARERSGTLITVNHGLEQGKDIFAVPARIGDMVGSGCNRLIQNGAKLIMDYSDIITELQLRYPQLSKNKQQNTCKNKLGFYDCEKNNNTNKTDLLKKIDNSLETEEKIVYASLSLEPKHIEVLAQETGYEPKCLMEKLFSLEMKDYIRQIGINYYVICLE